MLPPALMVPLVLILPLLTFPVTDTTPVPALNVNPALAPAFPLLLNKTCVLVPGACKFPDIFPRKLPIK